MKTDKKVFVLGIDAMDPRLTRKFVDEGYLPNVKKLIELGSARQDLVMLGAHPTVTPPMWATLSTGAYANTHGITGFWKQIPGKLDHIGYNMDSKELLAEQLWDVTAKAGYKTLVFHWPGGSWPPTCDNENLIVIDGTHPGAPFAAMSSVDGNFLLLASDQIKETTFKAKAATDSNIACVIEDLNMEKDENPNDKDRVDLASMSMDTNPDGNVNIFLDPMDGDMQCTDSPYDTVLSVLKDAKADSYSFAIPEDAKEFTILYQKGSVRRIGLVTKNENGVYDTVSIYKNKKTAEPIAVIKNGEYQQYVWDTMANRAGEMSDKIYRWARVIHIEEDGSGLTMWFGAAMDSTQNRLCYPEEVYEDIVANVGYPATSNMAGGANKELLQKVTLTSWGDVAEWQAAAQNYLIEEKGVEVIFSHYHNIDAIGHMIIKHQKKGHGKLTGEDYQELVRDLYIQADDYVGKHMHLLDDGWTIMLVSDHGQVCPEHEAFFGLGEPGGTHVKFLEELGYTKIFYDEDGNPLRKIDWEHTRAVASRENYIWINLKGRDEHGIVEPEDKYALETQLITDMMGYKHPETGQHIFSMVLRNRDAVLVGLGGDRCGDIIYFLAEGYNYDHADSISTTLGEADTSVSPIFVAAGPGIKANYETSRVIRQVDVAPTVAVLLGTRMPEQCEGAPIYQILDL